MLELKDCSRRSCSLSCQATEEFRILSQHADRGEASWAVKGSNAKYGEKLWELLKELELVEPFRHGIDELPRFAPQIKHGIAPANFDNLKHAHARNGHWSTDSPCSHYGSWPNFHWNTSIMRLQAWPELDPMV
jgi:hypothetical protein